MVPVTNLGAGLLYISDTFIGKSQIPMASDHKQNSNFFYLKFINIQIFLEHFLKQEQPSIRLDQKANIKRCYLFWVLVKEIFMNYGTCLNYPLPPVHPKVQASIQDHSCQIFPKLYKIVLH